MPGDIPSLTASVGDGGENYPGDVDTLRTLLDENVCATFKINLLPMSRAPDHSDLAAAIKAFQKQVMRQAHPTGRVDTNDETMQALCRNRTAEPDWMKIARGEIGIKAIGVAARSNPRILTYLSTFPELHKQLGCFNHMKDETDSTPWCACFVNWCLVRAGQQRGPSPAAADWVRYGTALEKPKPGAIVIVHNPKHSHVAFYAGGRGKSNILLGGNQGPHGNSKVSEETFKSTYHVVGYRWPVSLSK